MRISCGTVLGLLLAFAGLLRADLKQVMAEPNLERRSKLALDNAEAAYQALRTAYNRGDNPQAAAAASEIRESVNLAYASLTETGKNPRKSPKYFKQAEIKTRDLLRRLDGFQQEMGFDDRGMLDETKARLQQVHDQLLMGLMEGKHK